MSAMRLGFNVEDETTGKSRGRAIDAARNAMGESSWHVLWFRTKGAVGTTSFQPLRVATRDAIKHTVERRA